MNLNRLRNSLLNRDWGSKTKKTNINYLKNKLKDFDMNVPKYLKNGQLSDYNIKSITNRIIKAIDKKREILRATPDLPSKEKALKSLQKTIEKHNKTVLKKIPMIQEKYNITEKQLNYLMGYTTNFDYGAYNNSYAFSYYRDNTQFRLYTDDMNFNKVSTIVEYEKMIKEQTKRLSNENIKKELGTGTKAKQSINDKLKEWEKDSILSKENRRQISQAINSLSPIQKEILYKMMISTGMYSVKYTRKGNDDDDDDLQYNINRKMSILISKAKEF